MPVALLALALGTVSPLSGAGGRVVPMALPLVNTWIKPVDAAEGIAPAATLDYVFVATAAGKIEGHGMADYELKWTKDFTATRDLVAGDGLVYVCTADGVMALAEATGEIRWHADIKATGAAPVWRTGWLFLSTTSGTLAAYHTADGSQAWQHTLGVALSSPPVPTATQVIVSLSDRRLVSLGTADGHEMWRQALRETSTSLSWPVLSAHLSPGYETGSLVPITTTAPSAPGMPTAANGLVYVNGDDGCLYFLRADTGSFGNPTCLIGGRAVGGPAADASHVYTAALDGTLAAYGHHSGTLEWRTDLKSRIAASPFVDGRLLFVPLATGEIVVYVAATLDLGQAARLAAPPADGASSTQMSGSAVVAGAGDTLHIVTVTNTGQTWALSAYAKAHLSISPLTTVPGRPLPPSGAGGLPAPR